MIFLDSLPQEAGPFCLSRMQDLQHLRPPQPQEEAPRTDATVAAVWQRTKATRTSQQPASRQQLTKDAPRQPLAYFKPAHSVIHHIYGHAARGVAGGAGWGRFN